MTQHGGRVDLHEQRVQTEVRDLQHGGDRVGPVAQQLPPHVKFEGEVPDVGEVADDLDHVGQRPAQRAQDAVDVAPALRDLRAWVPGSYDLVAFVEGDLTGE